MRANPTPLHRAAWPLVLTVASLLTGCAAGQMTNMWRDDTYKAPPLKNVLVVALRKDPVRRRVWEDSFVHGLEVRGTRATASYKQYPDAPPDTEQVTEMVRRDGYDGVIGSVRLPDDLQEEFVPGYVRREPITGQSRFTGGYYTIWRDVYVPDRVETVKAANFRTDVWTTTEGGRLVWSGTSRTMERVNAKIVKNKVDKLILPALDKAGIVPGKSGQ